MAQFGPSQADRPGGRRPLPSQDEPAQRRGRPAQPGGDWCGGNSAPDPSWCGGVEPPEPWCDSTRPAETIVLGAAAGLVRALGRRLS